MAAVLRFDNIDVDGTAVAETEFVSGSGRLTLTGDDVTTTTADGRIQHDRRILNLRAECSLYGDYNSLETDNGLGVVCQFLRGTSTVKTATMAVSVVVSGDVADKQSRVSFVGDAG